MAVRPIGPQTPKDLCRMQNASAVLLRNIEAAASAVSWAELARLLGPQGRPLLDRLERSMTVIGLHRGAARLASELLHRLRKSQDICPRCFSALDSASCPGCHRQVSAQQRIADALIVATAELAPDVEVIFTFDAGMLAFAPLLTTCDIRTPPLHDNLIALPDLPGPVP